MAVVAVASGTAACSGTATLGAPSAPATAASAAPRSSTPASPPDRAASSPRTSASGSPAEGSVTVAASGDILVHHSVQVDAARNAGGGGFDFRPMFADVRSLVSSADVAICHQETPVSADNTSLTGPGVLSYNAPRQLAEGLRWAGFDGCDTASNHMWDRGLTGIRSTAQVLDRAGLAHAGASGSAAGAGRPARYRTSGGAIVANLAYSYTITNQGGPNTSVPPSAPWLRRALWPAQGAAGIERDARAARGRGADIVVVSLHWGSEYHRAPTVEQRALARQLLRSGVVDLIVGAHAHVVQPCEKINGRYVVYGMGNFLSNQAPSQGTLLTPSTQDGVLVLATFQRRADGTFRSQLAYQPTTVQTDGHVIRLATPTSHAASFHRTVAAMDALGPGACDARPRR